MSHSLTPEFDYMKDNPNWWDWWVRTNAENHALYMQTLHQHHVIEKRNPIYFIRYEDLILNKEAELIELFKFILELNSLEGTNIEKRIKQVIQAGQDNATLYKLKQSTGKLNI